MSHALVNQLSEQRKTTWEQAKALLDKAAGEGRGLTAEEEQSYQRMSTDLTSMRARIDLIEETERQNAAAEETLRKLQLNPSGAPDGANGADGDIEAQFRALAKGETRSVDIAPQAMRDVWSRALSKGTATAGGNTVKTSFQDQLVQHLVESAGVLQLGPTILNTTSGENIDIPITTSHGAAALVTEAGTLAGTDPAFGKRTLGAYKYGQLVLVPKELADDTSVDLIGYIAQTAGRNVGLAFGAHLSTGTGTSQPAGVITGATAGVTGATAVAGAFTADNLIDLFFSVIAPYRNSRSAGWLLKDASLGAVRKLKDGAGRYLFDTGMGVGAPDTILGKPVTTDPNIAAVGLSAKSVAFGDFSRYFVRLAGGVRFERSDEFKFDSDQIAFRCLMRGDGMLVDQTGAVKYFVGGAS